MKLFKADVITNTFYGIIAVHLFFQSYPPFLLLSLCALMIGSSLHHYVMTHESSYFDWIAIYLVFIALGTMAWGLPQWVWIVVGALLAFIDKRQQGEYRYVMVSLCACYLLTAVIYYWGIHELMRIAFLFALAFVPWKIGEDINKTVSPRYSLYHGLWHILTSYAILQTALLVG